jgi:hypothetical protein
VIELEQQRPKNPEPVDDDQTTAYITTAVGIGLIIAAVLVMITAQTAAAGFPFILGATACLGVGIARFARRRKTAIAPPSGERELLSAIRHHGGSITPAEAAIETSLTVRDADKMLSGLAGKGHLLVESRGGASCSTAYRAGRAENWSTRTTLASLGLRPVRGVYSSAKSIHRGSSAR